jgi:hypothetical protein
MNIGNIGIFTQILTVEYNSVTPVGARSKRMTLATDKGNTLERRGRYTCIQSIEEWTTFHMGRKAAQLGVIRFRIYVRRA